ncbi:MAG: V-type ATP synthase subunit E [Halobacteriales archaeon]|nr:V-type ATP synthase subunit E [Halobacteriales archaeon]
MSLETVVEDIREEARARADEIREDAEARAEAIIADAESDAEEIIADAEQDVEQQIEQEREQRLSSANLEAKQARLEARRDMLESVRDAVEDRIESLEGDQRRDLTASLLEAAAPEFDDVDSVSVYGRADDADLIEDLCADYEGFEYAGEYDCLGGVVLESEGSRLRVNNTFDSVLEDVWDDSLRDISDQLFESDTTGEQ